MALVLKTSDTERYRGFESLSLRHLNCIGQAVQKYPRGRRGSPAKGVGCVKRREGSNPSFCAKEKAFLQGHVPSFRKIIPVESLIADMHTGAGS